MTNSGIISCPACGEANPPGKRFCGDCGASLQLLCPACGALSAAGKRFCGDCGSPLVGTASASALPDLGSTMPAVAATDEERRLVTVLFADLVGFTSLAERLDPEQVREVQAEYFGAMRTEIKRAGGTLDKYAGDAVLAMFGVPAAHEDDAERGVRCALAMQGAVRELVEEARRRWGAELALRVGVNTGEVVTGVWDLQGRKDYAVSGDAVNTASRLETAAEPGGVLVGAETMHLTQHCIRFGEPRELRVRGKARPLVAYLALGLQDRVVERWETLGQSTPLVGRQQEVRQLLDLWERARESEGQLVTLVGDAGVGKSRLVVEVVNRIQARGEVRVLEGRCFGYSQQISLWLVADLLRDLCGITMQDGPTQTQSRLRITLGDLLREQDEATRAAAIDVLGEVLGLPAGRSSVAGASAQVRRQVLVRSLRLLLAASERTPALLVLQDLHWIDPASTEVMTEILADVPGLRLLVLAAQRPGWSAPWNEWSWPERLSVRPLNERDAAVLAGAVLGGVALGPGLERYVSDRAGGNPFFVEEVLRALQEAGDLEAVGNQMELAPGAAQRLPTTLTEILLARLDRLERQVRSLAQVASVIGRQFAVRLLAHVVGREATALEMPLVKLQQAEIVFPRRGTDLEYAFRHALLRDVAYTTLLHKRRQALHAATARAMATLYPEDEGAEMIAYHFSRTEEHMEAATWLERAGDLAARKFDNDTALDRYEEAERRLHAAGQDGTALARINAKRGRVLRAMGRNEDALEVLEEAAKAYREAGDLEAVANVVASSGWVHVDRATPAEGIEHIQATLESMPDGGPSGGRAALHVALAALEVLAMRFDEALETSNRAVELADAVGDVALRAQARTYRGMSLLRLRRREEGLQELEEAIPLAEQTDDPDVLRSAFAFTGFAYLMGGRLEESQRHYRRSVEVAELTGDMSWAAVSSAFVGFTAFHLGDWDLAQEYLERAVNMEAPALHSAFPPRWLGQLYLAQGRWEEASELLEEAVEREETAKGRVFPQSRPPETLQAELHLFQRQPDEAQARLQSMLNRLRVEEQSDAQIPTSVLPYVAWTRLELGHVDRAEQLARQGVERATRERHVLALVDAHRVQGMVLARQERWEDATASFRESASEASAMHDRYAEARAHHEHGLMHARRGDSERARDYLENALTIYQQLGAERHIEQTQRTIAELEQL